MPREFKNILVTLVPQNEAHESPTAALKMSLALAQEASAFVTIDFLSPRPAWIPYSLFSDGPAQMITREGERLDAMAEKGLAAAKSAADAANISSSSELLALDFIAMMGRSARHAHLQDVVVMDAKSGALREYSEIIEGMLFRSGRPVVLVPEGWDAGVPRKIAIAWDGSVQAVRAVTEALPILQKADEVRVLTVKGEKDLTNATPSDRLAVYLEHHGVRVQQETLTAQGGRVTTALRDHVVSSESQMIVMGAYAHTRLREAVLGGVTRSLLESSSVPLFMSH